MTDPLAAYSFNAGNAVDDTTNGNTGTLVGTNMTWVPGHTSGGANSSGTSISSYIAVPDAAGIRPAAGVTLECWAKLSSTQVTSSAFIIGKTRSGGDESWSLYAGPTNSLFGIVSGSNVSTFANDTTTGGLLDDTWHHLAGTYDGSHINYYIDSVLAAGPIAASGSLVYDTSPFCLGGSSSHSSDRMVGILDDVRIYDVALSQPDIATDMATPVVPAGGGGGGPTGSAIYALRDGSWVGCTLYALRDGIWTPTS